jgi:hypothetical protein
MGPLNRHYMSHAAMLGMASMFSGIDRQPFNGNQEPPKKFENKNNAKKLGKYKLSRNYK